MQIPGVHCLRHVILSFLTSKKAYVFKALSKQMQLCWLTTPNIVCLFAHRCFFCCWMLLNKVWKPHHTVMEMVAMLVAQLAVLAASLCNLFVTYNTGGMMSI